MQKKRRKEKKKEDEEEEQRRGQLRGNDKTKTLSMKQEEKRAEFNTRRYTDDLT